MAQPRLQQVSTHAWAWLDGTGRWEHPNSGLIADRAGGLLVNTQYDTQHTSNVLAAVTAEVPEVRIDRVVITDASPHHHWGHDALPGAEVLVSKGTASQMAKLSSPDQLAEMIDGSDPDLPLGRHLRETLGCFEIAGVKPLAPVGTFSDRTSLQIGAAAVELIDFGVGYSEADTVVWLPDESVLFTGDLLCLGVHPAVRSGSFSSWLTACSSLAALRPATVVPGHGPVTDIAGIIDFRDYLAHLLAEVQSRFSRGMPLEDTVVDLPLRHWAQWSQPENLAVTVATIYRQLGSSDPASSAAVTTLSAEIAAGLRRKPRIKPIPPGDHDPEAVRLLGLIHGEAAIFDLHSVHTPNVILTSLRHPWLFEPGVPLARAVVTGILAGRDREMLILRGAWNCAAAYQWNHHRQLALAAGLSDAEIDLLSKALPQSAWTTQEAALLQAADELHAQSTITDQTWALLEGYYNEQELIELVTLVGEYTKVSFQLNAWQVSVEMWLGPIHLPSGWTGRST